MEEKYVRNGTIPGYSIDSVEYPYKESCCKELQEVVVWTAKLDYGG